MTTSEFIPAFILHLRPYKENQALVDLLVKDYGRITAVTYRGSKKNSAKNALLQPFKPLLIQYKEGKTLHKLNLVEPNPELQIIDFYGKPQFCGFYLNEIICRLCPADAMQEGLYPYYLNGLRQLSGLQNIDEVQKGQRMQIILRQFEFQLLSELGYGVDFESTLDTHQEIESHRFYQLFDGNGFVESTKPQLGLLGQDIINCRVLLFESENVLVSPDTLRVAKNILRQCLQLHLGDKPIKSRELFR